MEAPARLSPALEFPMALLTKVLIASTVASLALLSGCASKACCDDSGEKAAQKTADGKVVVINTMCPIGGDDFGSKERSSDLARTYNGKAIGFCCDHCVQKFDKMSDEKKQATVAAASANKAM
jgi:YHS domain-containing protein